MMATGGDGDRFSLKLWHLPDGKLVRTYNYFNGYVRSGAFNPSDTWIIVSDNAGVTHVLDVTTEQLTELKDMYAPLLSAQGDVLMTVSKFFTDIFVEPRDREGHLLVFLCGLQELVDSFERAVRITQH